MYTSSPLILLTLQIRVGIIKKFILEISKSNLCPNPGWNSILHMEIRNAIFQHVSKTGWFLNSFSKTKEN